MWMHVIVTTIAAVLLALGAPPALAQQQPAASERELQLGPLLAQPQPG